MKNRKTKVNNKIYQQDYSVGGFMCSVLGVEVKLVATATIEHINYVLDASKACTSRLARKF